MVDKLTKGNLHLEAALTWHDQGFCVMPARFDGSKRPRFEWKEFQGERPIRESVIRWYRNEPDLGVGLICGAVSGGLEMLELEGSATSSSHLDKIRAECDARDITWLWDMLTLEGYAEWTPSGGIHLLYQIPGHDIPGNTKIAMTASKATLAETRGEGGFVIVAPTSGTVHQTGEPWTLAAGQLGTVPTITWEDRETLHHAIKAAIDERVERAYEAPAPRPIRERAPGEISPMDDLNDRGDWTSLLTERGWSYAGRMAGQELWTRPGKDPKDGHSAALGYQGSPNLYVWSGMDEERHYTKAQFVGYSDHNGDWAATTRELARQGYGTPLEPRTPQRRSDYDYSDLLPERAAVTADEANVEADVEALRRRPRIAEFDDLNVCRFLAATSPWKVRYVSQERGWRAYQDGRWIVDHRGGIEDFIRTASDEVKAQAYARLAQAKEVDAEQGSADSKDRLKGAQSEASYAKATASNRGLKALTETLSGTRGIKVSTEDFDQVKHLLPLSNGTLNLKTMELEDHNPRNMLTQSIKVAFNPEASAPMWEKVLADWFPDVDQRRYVQRLAGYTLTAETTQAAVPILYGEGGAGKSVFFNVLRAAFGEFATNAEGNTFLIRKGESTNSVHDLRGARLVTISEIPPGATLNEELVKRFSGGDQMTTRALYQDNQVWKPVGTIWMATNDLPKFRPDDTGMARRIKPVKFFGTFEGKVDRTFGLDEKIIEAELAGVLNWLLEGVRMYRELGLAEPSQITEAFKDYQAELDPVARFLAEGEEAERIVVEANQRVKPNELYGAFHAFCTDNNVPRTFIYSQHRFSTRLKALGYEQIKSNGSKFWIGVGLDVRNGVAAAQQPRFQGRQF